jgi:F-type H+/Na+-transporting ATPase subunit alpha
VPVREVRNFERDYLNVLEAQHKGVLDSLKKGEFNDQITGVLEKVAKELITKYIA